MKEGLEVLLLCIDLICGEGITSYRGCGVLEIRIPHAPVYSHGSALLASGSH
jgi:hypothetical protein